jgi:hypothetical protein
MEKNQILRMPGVDDEPVAREAHEEVRQCVAAAQMLFAAFRNAHSELQTHDWCSFDKGMELLGQANREMQRLKMVMKT